MHGPIFAVFFRDLGLLSDDDFAEVWRALALLARNRGKRIISQDQRASWKSWATERGLLTSAPPPADAGAERKLDDGLAVAE